MSPEMQMLENRIARDWMKLAKSEGHVARMKKNATKQGRPGVKRMEVELLNELVKAPIEHSGDCAALLGVHKTTVSLTLRDMVRHGWVERIGYGRGASFKITDRGLSAQSTYGAGRFCETKGCGERLAESNRSGFCIRHNAQNNLPRKNHERESR